MPGCAAVYRRGAGRRACTLLVTTVTFILGGGMARHDAAAAKPARPEKHGIVVAVSPPGADAGRDILKKGGNAVDAAVATAFAMAVTYPAAGNIGGGGFMLIHPAGGKSKPVVIDYRERAPARGSQDHVHQEG